MKITLVGLSYKTTPLKQREVVHLSSDQTPDFLQRLRGVVREAFVISTCNRFEIIAAHDNQEIFDILATAISDYFHLARQTLEGCLYQYSGFPAVRHLFRVASSLDSMVVGEAQILGQMKQFFAIAQQSNSIDASLHPLIERAFMVAKKVRTETGIASSCVSIPSVAVDLACRIFGEMEAKTAIVIGAGKMGLLALQHLKAHGVKNILLTNRTFSRAEELAKEINGTAFHFENLAETLAAADIVIGSSGSADPVVRKSEVQAALTKRKNKAMLLIDIAVPRDLDPSIDDLSNVYLYNLDDLKNMTDKNRSDRQMEAKFAEEIVHQEAEHFWSRFQALDPNPMIRKIRETAEEICRQELSVTLARIGSITPEQKLRIEKLVSSLTDKILQTPFFEMRQLAAEPGNLEKIAFISNLFQRNKPA